MISQSLLQQVLEFRRERDWEQFHNLRTLATSIMLEAAELAEITQWTRDDEIADVSDRKKGKVEEEVADIAILLSYLIHDVGIDLDAVVKKKLELNARKYPVARSKGSAKKYDELDQ
jgi:NTP pyrophosphatase (non-canonical NTP hydrolase)